MYSTSYCSDSLTITTESGMGNTKHCDEKIPNPSVRKYQGKKLRLTFKSSLYNEYKGFRLKFTSIVSCGRNTVSSCSKCPQTPSGCGGDCEWRQQNCVQKVQELFEMCQPKDAEKAFADHGSITSPGYPNHYPSYSECELDIVTGKNFTAIRIEFLDFKLEEGNFKCYDSLTIIPESGNSTKLCDEQLPVPAVRQYWGNTIKLEFKSDGTKVFKGFKLNFTAVAAPVPCAQMDIDYIGVDINYCRIKVSSWEECSSLCSKVQNCKYWTLLWNKHCCTKNGTGTVKVTHGVISGAAGCGIFPTTEPLTTSTTVQPTTTATTGFRTSTSETNTETKSGGTTKKILTIDPGNLPISTKNPETEPTQRSETEAAIGQRDEEGGLNMMTTIIAVVVVVVVVSVLVIAAVCVRKRSKGSNRKPGGLEMDNIGYEGSNDETKEENTYYSTSTDVDYNDSTNGGGNCEYYSTTETKTAAEPSDVNYYSSSDGDVKKGTLSQVSIPDDSLYDTAADPTDKELLSSKQQSFSNSDDCYYSTTDKEETYYSSGEVSRKNTQTKPRQQKDYYDTAVETKDMYAMPDNKKEKEKMNSLYGTVSDNYETTIDLQEALYDTAAERNTESVYDTAAGEDIYDTAVDDVTRARESHDMSNLYAMPEDKQIQPSNKPKRLLHKTDSSYDDVADPVKDPGRLNSIDIANMYAQPEKNTPPQEMYSTLSHGEDGMTGNEPQDMYSALDRGHDGNAGVHQETYSSLNHGGDTNMDRLPQEMYSALDRNDHRMAEPQATYDSLRSGADGFDGTLVQDDFYDQLENRRN